MKNRKEYYLLIKLYEKFVLHISSGGFDVKVNTIIMVKVKKYIKPFQFERNDAKYCRTRKHALLIAISIFCNMSTIILFDVNLRPIQ